MPFTKDKINGQYERSLDQVQAAARKVLQYNGQLASDDIVNRVLVGKIDTRTVYVRLTELEPAVTAVTVQARRKGGGADGAPAALFRDGERAAGRPPARRIRLLPHALRDDARAVARRAVAGL